MATMDLIEVRIDFKRTTRGQSDGSWRNQLEFA
uniref:Uncharacterized protein n=1 Tax=Solanum lycopersicum TaxID=4081 RepID=A0A494G9I3_SOLLC